MFDWLGSMTSHGHGQHVYMHILVRYMGTYMSYKAGAVALNRRPEISAREAQLPLI